MKPLYFFHETNRYIEKYLSLISINREKRDILKIQRNIEKIETLFHLKDNNVDDYNDNEYIKVKVKNQMMIHLTVKMYGTFILTISAFDYNVKYYPKVFLEGCLFKLVERILQMLHYNKIDIPKGIEFNKTSASTKRIFCHYFYLLKGLDFSYLYT